MTREELLSEINFDLEDNPHDKYILATRAVVELHKPNEFNDCCNGCDSDLPCPTIQAIEKEFQ